MQQSIQQAATLADKKHVRQTILLSVAGFLGSVGVTLTAIFALSSWAEVSSLHHAIQHVLIFVSGAGAYAALFTTHKTKKDPTQ